MLRFDERKIREIALRYQYAELDTELIDMKPAIENRGFVTRDELYKIARWKAPRNSSRVLKNSEVDVAEISRFALHTRSEKARVESLLMLYGVGWPMASVILHFFHKDPYPILDFRALWSISLERPSYYSFDFWWAYVQFCRQLIARNGIDMRTLDKALWQYSNENQSS